MDHRHSWGDPPTPRQDRPAHGEDVVDFLTRLAMSRSGTQGHDRARPKAELEPPSAGSPLLVLSGAEGRERSTWHSTRRIDGCFSSIRFMAAARWSVIAARRRPRRSDRVRRLMRPDGPTRRSTKRPDAIPTRRIGFIPICSKGWRSRGPIRSHAPTSLHDGPARIPVRWSRSLDGHRAWLAWRLLENSHGSILLRRGLG